MSCFLPLGTMLCVLCILQFMFYTACGCIVEERAALMRIRSSLVEANSEVPASWGQSDDCCSWERVTCNNNSRVSDLNLYFLYEQLPQSETEGQANSESEDGFWNLNLMIFSSFHELQLLDLCGNYARFQNFDGLQGLTKLRYLNLSFNILIGNNTFDYLNKMTSLEVINLHSLGMGAALPNRAFKNLKNLRELDLGSTQLYGCLLYGSIPGSLFELPRLKYLDLSGNLLQGHIPISSSPVLPSSLQTLRLSSNNLNGTFDFFWLRNCSMLKKVDLSGNADLAIDVKFRQRVPLFQLTTLTLSGCNVDNSIIAGPNFLGTQRHLQILDLSNNNLTGIIPKWILANEVNLVYLNLANNSLVGSLDLMWQRQSNIEIIDISRNCFIGQLPTNISSVFPNLKVLDTSYNTFSGELPLSLCKIRNLVFVNLSNNQFAGEVPTCLFTNCSRLVILNLSNNNLGGPILGGASNLSVAEAIYLASNNFEGTLPINLTGNMEIMDFHDNKLSGKLDVSFWNLSRLRVFSVASNRLNGEIDTTICKLSSLVFLDMSNNDFGGFMPTCSNKLTLQFVNMSSNALSGSPSAFFNNSYVNVLDLRYNRFEGSLHWIQHLSLIKMLLLSGNEFEGQISPDLCELQSLDIFDLSHNRLSGSLPPCIGGISFGYRAEDFWSSVENDGYAFMYSN